MSYRVTAFIVSLLVGCSIAFCTTGQTLRDQKTVLLMGNWRIDINRENQSLSLVATVSEGEGAYFTIQCYSTTLWRTLGVPLFDVGERRRVDKVQFVRITAWNDNGKNQELELLKFNDFVAVGIADKTKLGEGKKDVEDAFSFLRILDGAKSFFAFEAGGPTRTYDVRHYPAARNAFNRMCEEIHDNWNGFVGRY